MNEGFLWFQPQIHVLGTGQMHSPLYTVAGVPKINNMDVFSLSRC